MDEECLRPGDSTDMTMLTKLDKNLSYHNHFVSHKKADVKLQKIMGRDVLLNLVQYNALPNNYFAGISFNSLCWGRYLQC